MYFISKNGIFTAHERKYKDKDKIKIAWHSERIDLTQSAGNGFVQRGKFYARRRPQKMGRGGVCDVILCAQQQQR